MLYLAPSCISVFEVDLVYSAAEIDHPTVTFKADFLHHFIEDEIIRGYANPKLHFYFTPVTMECFFSYTFDRRSPDAVNLETVFEAFFVNDLILDRKVFEEKLSKQSTYELPGKKIDSVKRGESEFEIYYAENLTDERMAWFNRNIQVFLKFMIETGSYIDETDSLWKIIFMVERVSCSHRDFPRQNICGICHLLPLHQAAGSLQG